jgi:hypothetical protein
VWVDGGAGQQPPVDVLILIWECLETYNQLEHRWHGLKRSLDDSVAGGSALCAISDSTAATRIRQGWPTFPTAVFSSTSA